MCGIFKKIATKEELKDLPVKGRDYSFEHKEWQTRLGERCLSSEASDYREAVGANEEEGACMYRRRNCQEFKFW